MSKRIVFLGGGNMAEAIIKGVLRKRVFTKNDIFVADVRKERLSDIKKCYGVEIVDNNPEGARKADILVLAVKPQQIAGLLEEIKDEVQKKQLVA